MDSAKVSEMEPCENASNFCTDTSFDILDSASAADSDINQCEDISAFCIYTPIDNLGTTSKVRNDPTPMGPEGTLCKFIQSISGNVIQCDEENGSFYSDILQCDGADTASEDTNNDSRSSYNSEEEADSNPV